MWCSGPLAPHIVKQWGVQIIFILNVVLTFGPSHSEIVGCWGIQITFILYVVLGTFSPSNCETKSCFHYKILSMHMNKREINILMYGKIYYIYVEKCTKSLCPHAVSKFLFSKQIQCSGPLALPFCALVFFLDAVLRSFSHLVRCLELLINIFIVLWPLIL